MNDLLNELNHYQNFLIIFLEAIGGNHECDHETLLFGDCVEGIHRGYNPHYRKFERTLSINGIMSGKYVLLDEWQISFNPLGHASRYGFLQVTLYNPDGNPKHYWQTYHGQYQWNCGNRFMLGQDLNEQARDKMNDTMQNHGFTIDIDNNRIISPPFEMTNEGVINCLYYLAIFSLSKWEIENDLRNG